MKSAVLWDPQLCVCLCVCVLLLYVNLLDKPALKVTVCEKEMVRQQDFIFLAVLCNSD